MCLNYFNFDNHANCCMTISQHFMRYCFCFAIVCLPSQHCIPQGDKMAIFILPFIGVHWLCTIFMYNLLYLMVTEAKIAKLVLVKSLTIVVTLRYHLELVQRLEGLFIHHNCRHFGEFCKSTGVGQYHAEDEEDLWWHQKTGWTLHEPEISFHSFLTPSWFISFLNGYTITCITYKLVFDKLLFIQLVLYMGNSSTLIKWYLCRLISSLLLALKAYAWAKVKY